jgi:tricorn protease
MNTKASLTIAFCFAIAAGSIAATSNTLPDGFYRYPTIGGGTIVFAAEGDLWKVPVAGGVALRLTAFEGEEAFPKLSPDGSTVAFTAQYDGNDDVYIMTASGGEPVRLTYHPAPDQALGWSPDGKILFRSRRDTPNNDFRI